MRMHTYTTRPDLHTYIHVSSESLQRTQHILTRMHIYNTPSSYTRIYADQRVRGYWSQATIYMRKIFARMHTYTTGPGHTTAWKQRGRSRQLAECRCKCAWKTEGLWPFGMLSPEEVYVGWLWTMCQMWRMFPDCLQWSSEQFIRICSYALCEECSTQLKISDSCLGAKFQKGVCIYLYMYICIYVYTYIYIYIYIYIRHRIMHACNTGTHECEYW